MGRPKRARGCVFHGFSSPWSIIIGAPREVLISALCAGYRSGAARAPLASPATIVVLIPRRLLDRWISYLTDWQLTTEPLTDWWITKKIWKTSFKWKKQYCFFQKYREKFFNFFKKGSWVFKKFRKIKKFNDFKYKFIDIEKKWSILKISLSSHKKFTKF